MDPYATHLPHLIRAVLMTGGPVLELGMGDYSTPILLELCRKGRRLRSVDNDHTWHEKYAPQFSSDKNESFLLEDWRGLPDWGFAWSVIFVDLHPPEMRRTVLDKVWDRGDIIIAHDSEALDFDWTRLKYHQEYPSLEGPRTMMASNVLDVTR